MTFPSPHDATPPAARRGIALVITLLMLSVVTITAVAFLAVSRRERDSVTTFAEQVDARYVAEAGLNHAQARLASRMSALTNRAAHGGFMVSTNFINPFFRFGFSYADTRNFRALTNVAYARADGSPLFDLSTDNGRAAYARMLGNLYYDPRPPVFVQTNRNPQVFPRSPWDFRFYLDLNRNGQFETNGLQIQRDAFGRTNGLQLEWMWGDPEWIGLLQHPDVPHSGTNQFVGRFAYVVVPADRTLDINHLGNDAKRLNLAAPLPPVALNAPLLPSGFLRNQGVGTWEINPAGFFAALNTNIWLATVNDYVYRTNLNAPSIGLAFSDAERLWRFRQDGFVPMSAVASSGVASGRPDTARINDLFRRDFVDGYSDGPLVLTLEDIRGRLDDNDVAARPWPGSDLTNHFVELNDLFQPRLGIAHRVTGQYTNNSGIRQTSLLSSYDSHTFYRLLGQLGTDSGDARIETGLHPAYSDVAEAAAARPRRPSVNPYGFYRRPRLHLNYAPDVPGDLSLSSANISSFRPWEPAEWFTNAAHRILLSEFTNGLPFLPPGLQNMVPGLAVHGPIVVNTPSGPVATNHVYDAQVHRLLQVAANIYDAANNRFVGSGADRVALPSVYRPVFYRDVRTPNLLRLHGFQEILGGTPDFLLRRDWITADQAINRLSLSRPENDQTSLADFNVYGMPWVVGAKEGLPNFNQALWQTVVQPTRRLKVRRPNQTARMASPQNDLPFAGSNGSGFSTEYQFLINLTNLVGFEAWNSYARPFNREVRIFATNVLDFALTDETSGGASVLLMRRREMLSTNVVVPRGWAPRAYVAPGLVRDAASAQFLQFPPGLASFAGPIPGGFAVGTSFIYDPFRRLALPPSRTNEGWVEVSQANQRFLTPVISAYVTNRFLFAITDVQTGRLLDFVTQESVMIRTNLLSTLGLDSDGQSRPFFANLAGGTATTTMPSFWRTNLLAGGNRTIGLENQMRASIGQIPLNSTLWRDLITPGGGGVVPAKDYSIDGLNYFLYGILPPGGQNQTRLETDFGSKLQVQVGFNPSPRIFLSDRRMANDPLVHYTKEDLFPGYALLTEAEYVEIPDEFFGWVRGSDRGIQLTTNTIAFDVGRQRKFVSAYAPWGTNANFTGIRAPSDPFSGAAYNYAYKDPQIQSSDGWRFPVSTNAQFRYAGVGELGRVHRGTPWQTLYLKSRPAPEKPGNEPSAYTRYGAGEVTWAGWAGNRRTVPTNDWKFVDLFTTALSETAARGQMGVNQTNLAAWSAVLTGVPVLQNTDPVPANDPRPHFLDPYSGEVRAVLAGYVDASGEPVPGLLDMLQARDPQNGDVLINPGGVFQNVGSILQVPTLSDRAPFLRSNLNWPLVRNVTDEVLERLPQQILSLLRTDDPRFVIYSYGQTLKPAQNAVNLRPGPLYGMTTNYTITGEYVTKTVMRLDGDPRRLEPVIESQRVVFSNP